MPQACEEMSSGLKMPTPRRLAPRSSWAVGVTLLLMEQGMAAGVLGCWGGKGARRRGQGKPHRVLLFLFPTPDMSIWGLSGQ